MTPSSPNHSDRDPEEPLAEVGREPLHEAIASARDERRGGISLQTLLVAAGASAVASFTVSHLWGAGTVLSAALTPVLVALASEFLRRPVEHVSATAQRVTPARPIPGAPGRAAQAEPPAARPAPPPAPDDWAPVNYGEPRPAGWRPRWRLVLLTGLLAFAIVVGVYTVPELLVGHSISGASGSTTLFSGPSAPAPQTKTDTTPTNPTTTTQTTTAAPPTTTTPTTPSTTDTAPQQATPPTDTTQTTPTDTTSTAPATSTPTAPTTTGTTTPGTP
ncbi:MAG: hypothetical protein QOF77_1307 [Solirubrobacteraceae bacterium]|nr:hypothetical protein [Solirubrobacteraceae bacterium]